MNSIILSCEHAGNEVLEKYQHLFETQPEVLDTHRGWDRGALPVSQYLSASLHLPLFQCTTSRLLIDLNRSLDSDSLFSEFSKKLDSDSQQELLDKTYHPYRKSIESEIANSIESVYHFSIHTFTPVWNGHERQVDVGLLFDPSRNFETATCEALRVDLQHQLPNLKIKFNEPYLGIDDGLTTYLRTSFTDQQYAGVEIELNQKFHRTLEMEKIQHALLVALRSLQGRN